MTPDYPWYHRRGYLHFDRPIQQKAASRIVKNADSVARHSFFPFIQFEIKTKRLKWSKEENKLVENNKSRMVSYASHVDSHIYSYYAHLLNAKYEARLNELGLSSNILAFRKLGESNIDFAKRAFLAITSRGECHVIGLDVEKFFNNLDHRVLKDAWLNALGAKSLPHDHYAVFKAITKHSTVDRDLAYALCGISKNNPRSEDQQICSIKNFRALIQPIIVSNKEGKGIPQGSPISALLSNIYMLEFDVMMKKHVSVFGGEYFRYCDDILLIVPPSVQEASLGFAENTIQKFGLNIQSKKTERRTFTRELDHNGNEYLFSPKPLQYLGFLFDGQRILLRSASLARYSDKVRRGIKLAKATMNKRNFARQIRGDEKQPIYKKNLRKLYTHFGRRNFLTYGHKAARTMNSTAIRKQLKPLSARFARRLRYIS